MEQLSNCCSWKAVLIWTARIHSMSKQTAKQSSWVADLDISLYCCFSNCLTERRHFCISLSAAVSHQPFAFSFSICPFSVDGARWVAGAAALTVVPWRERWGEGLCPSSPSAWTGEKAMLPGWCAALRCSSLPVIWPCLSWSRCYKLLDFSSPFLGSTKAETFLAPVPPFISGRSLACVWVALCERGCLFLALKDLPLAHWRENCTVLCRRVFKIFVGLM